MNERRPRRREWLAWAGDGRVLAIVAAFVAGAIAAYVLAGTLGDEAPGLLWRDASVQMRPVAALKGVRIGETLAEVTSRLGPFEADPLVRPGVDASKEGHYAQARTRLRLLVSEGRVRRVSYECRAGDGTRVNRVACNDPEPRVVEVFGNAARKLCAAVEATSPEAALAPHVYALDVADTGTRYVTIHGHVRGFIVMQREELDAAVGGDLIWQRCPR